MSVDFTVVIPSAGRPTVARLLQALAESRAPAPREVIVVLDGEHPVELAPSVLGSSPVRVLRSPGRGPAAARNVGWRAASSEWIAFLDDDVVPPPGWSRRLVRDLEAASPLVGGSQGRVRVPLAVNRRPTDHERNVAGLESAVWATADLAYRRSVLASVGGFDERFPRAYREDADLGLRVTSAGWAIARGERWVDHPVADDRPLRSILQQAGNADDVTMQALHGPGWRALVGAPGGRRPIHLALTAIAATAIATGLSGRRVVAASTAAAYAGGVAELAVRRIVPGPRTAREVLTMAATSAVLPVACTLYWLSGWARLPWVLRRPGPRPERTIVEERVAQEAVT